jgi:hypothetical protein
MKNENRSYLDRQMDKAGIINPTTRRRMKDLEAGVILDALKPEGFGVKIIIDGANSRVEPRTMAEANGATNATVKRAVENMKAREYNRASGRMVDGFMVYDN